MLAPINFQRHPRHGHFKQTLKPISFIIFYYVLLSFHASGTDSVVDFEIRHLHGPRRYEDFRDCFPNDDDHLPAHVS